MAAAALSSSPSSPDSSSRWNLNDRRCTIFIDPSRCRPPAARERLGLVRHPRGRRFLSYKVALSNCAFTLFSAAFRYLPLPTCLPISAQGPSKRKKGSQLRTPGPLRPCTNLFQSISTRLSLRQRTARLETRKWRRSLRGRHGRGSSDLSDIF